MKLLITVILVTNLFQLATWAPSVQYPFIAQAQTSPHVLQWINELQDTAMIRKYAMTLTTNFTTRHSQSKEGLRAANYLLSELQSLGFNASFLHYKEGYNPNVIATWAPQAKTPFVDETLVVGAHYDGRQKDIRAIDARAPAANDDGSGTTALLALANMIQGQQFEHPIALMFFSGEEQGLYGSAYVAQQLKEQDARLIGMIQCDMVGYKQPGYPYRLAFVNRHTDSEFTKEVKSAVVQYLPDLAIYESSACCSDHQSFDQSGYRSVGLVEYGGYSIDPQYHSIGDVVDRPGYSLEQIRYSAKALAAIVGHYAVLINL